MASCNGPAWRASRRHRRDDGADGLTRPSGPSSSASTAGSRRQSPRPPLAVARRPRGPYPQPDRLRVRADVRASRRDGGKNAWPCFYDVGIAWFDRAPVLMGIPDVDDLPDPRRRHRRPRGGGTCVWTTSTTRVSSTMMPMPPGPGRSRPRQGKRHEEFANRMRLTIAGSRSRYHRRRDRHPRTGLFAKAAVTRYPVATGIVDQRGHPARTAVRSRPGCCPGRTRRQRRDAGATSGRTASEALAGEDGRLHPRRHYDQPLRGDGQVRWPARPRGWLRRNRSPSAGVNPAPLATGSPHERVHRRAALHGLKPATTPVLGKLLVPTVRQ